MLLSEHRRRHKYRGLLAAEHAFHHRAQRYLGLAEANVAAEKSVHRHGGFHIALDFGDRAKLIVRLRVAEVILKFTLPLAVRREGKARQTLPLGVERNELLRHVLGGAFGACPSLCPFRAPHFRQLYRLFLARARIFRHHIKLSRRHIQAVRARVAQLNVVLFKPVHLHFHNSGKSTDTVIFMHDIIADREVGAGLYFLPPRRELFLGFFLCSVSDKLSIRQHRKPYPRIFHAGGHGAYAYRAASRLRKLIYLFIYQRPDILPHEEILQDLGAPLLRRKNHHAIVLLEIQRHIVRRRLCAARI